MRIGKLKKAGISLLSLFMIVGLFTSNVKTIEAADDNDNLINMNLFNYTSGGVDNGINYNHSLKFTGGNPAGYAKNVGTSRNPDWRDWTHYYTPDYNVYVRADGESTDSDLYKSDGAYAKSGIVKNKLVNGYPFSNDNDRAMDYKTRTYYTQNYEGESLAYLFNLEYSYGKNIYSNVKAYSTTKTGDNQGLLYKSGNHYSYDSTETEAHYDTENNSFNKSAINNPENAGFWPFNASNNASSKDYHFGMTMSASFNMTSDGTVDDQDMVFKFSGDDDVWVFIDDVLILDLGGIHDNIQGEINFKTGKIRVQNGWINNNKNYPKLVLDDKTIAEKLSQEGKSSYCSGSTLSSDVVHTIKFFYLERGEGGSNCKLDIYLPFIATKDITIGKDVDGVNDAFKDDYEFSFSAKFDGTYANEYKSIAYKKYDENNELVSEGVLTKTGEAYTFQLKDGQYIVLESVYSDSNITLQEINANDFDTYINGTIVSDKIFKDSIKNINNEINFRNSLKNDKKSSLTIEKKFNGDSTEDQFELDVKFGKMNYALIEFNGEYKYNGEDKDGIISTIKNNDTITIENIPLNYYYSVTENLTDEQDEKYLDPIYTLNNQNLTSNVNCIIKEKNNFKITNELFHSGAIQIEKIIYNINDVNFLDGDPIFTFEIRNTTTGKTYYQTIRIYKGENDDICFSELEKLTGLEAGDYTIKELSTMRFKFKDGTYYYNTDSNNKIDFNEDNVVIQINKNNKLATVSFVNELNYDKNFSHTDVVVNKFEVADDGTITLDPDDLKTTRE